ncbi:MAG: DnaB-like helicase N-terminal domain-containing protein, partial [Desulfobacterales bacterium]|nr:DnaB-like helicase N-terminal domain-containing protein [Desulfobacterales bacterium]
MSERQQKQGRSTSVPAPGGVVLPANAEMERSLLGFILADPKSLADMLDLLSPEDFDSEQHRQVYEAFIDLYGTQELTADVNLLAKKLVGARVFADIPAAKGFISNLLDPAAMSNHMYAPQYAEEIHSLAVQRALVRLSWEIPGLVKEGVGDSLMEVLDAVERRVFEVT